VGADAHPGDDALPGDVWYPGSNKIARRWKKINSRAAVTKDTKVRITVEVMAGILYQGPKWCSWTKTNVSFPPYSTEIVSGHLSSQALPMLKHRPLGWESKHGSPYICRTVFSGIRRTLGQDLDLWQSFTKDQISNEMLKKEMDKRAPGGRCSRKTIGKTCFRERCVGRRCLANSCITGILRRGVLRKEICGIVILG